MKKNIILFLLLICLQAGISFAETVDLTPEQAKFLSENMVMIYEDPEVMPIMDRMQTVGKTLHESNIKSPYDPAVREAEQLFAKLTNVIHHIVPLYMNGSRQMSPETQQKLEQQRLRRQRLAERMAHRRKRKLEPQEQEQRAVPSQQVVLQPFEKPVSVTDVLQQDSRPAQEDSAKAPKLQEKKTEVKEETLQSTLPF